MKKNTLIAAIFIIVGLYNRMYGTSIDVSGNLSINTVWSVDTVRITGETTVDNGVVLTIAPGTRVEFQGHYKLNVQGRLLAIGTVSENIVFTVSDTTGYSTDSHTGWHGIRFNGTPSSNDTSLLAHCILEYGIASGSGDDAYGGALYIYNFNKLKISNCSIRYNNAGYFGGGIYAIASALTIDSSIISYNKTLYYNWQDGGGGIGIMAANYVQIVNTLVSGNSCNGAKGGGVHSGNPFNGNMEIYNSTIYDNSSTDQGGGLFVENADLYLLNTIIAGNASGTSDPDLTDFPDVFINSDFNSLNMPGFKSLSGLIV